MRRLSVLVFLGAGLCGGSACGSSEHGDSHDASGGRPLTAGQGGAGAGVAGASTARGGDTGVPAGASNAAGTASAGTPSGAGHAGASGVSGAQTAGGGQGATAGGGGFETSGAGADAAGAGAAGDGGSSGGGDAPPPGSCGAEAGSGAMGGPYEDVTSRYTAAASPARAPVLDGSAELHAEHVFQGTLEDTDAPFIRVTNNCGQPPPGYTYTVDVYAIELVGPGPHDLVVDTCDSELLFSGGGFHPIDTVVMAYEDNDGSDHPLDLDDACPHLLTQADDGCSNYGGPSLLRMTGLREGTVQIAVTTFGGPPATPEPYVLHVWSDTSCE